MDLFYYITTDTMVKPFNELRICTVYKITIGEEFYIGSTTSKRSTRMCHHRFQLKKGKEWPLYIWIRDNGGWEAVEVSTVHACPVNNHVEQLQLEQRFMDDLKPTINKCGAHDTPDVKKAKKKEYYETNKEHLNAKKKEYYESNKEHLKAKGKEWAAENKESLTAYQKQWREDNKEAQKAYKKAWYQANKARLKAKDKAKYQVKKVVVAEKQKQRVECPQCAKNMNKGSLTRHLKKSCPKRVIY